MRKRLSHACLPLWHKLRRPLPFSLLSENFRSSGVPEEKGVGSFPREEVVFVGRIHPRQAAGQFYYIPHPPHSSPVFPCLVGQRNGGQVSHWVKSLPPPCVSQVVRIVFLFVLFCFFFFFVFLGQFFPPPFPVVHPCSPWKPGAWPAPRLHPPPPGSRFHGCFVPTSQEVTRVCRKN